MSRKYSSWAANQPVVTPDLSMMRLMTVVGNEQDQLKNIERVEAIPHMYINVDAPPPPTSRMDARVIQPSMIPRQNSSYFAAPAAFVPPNNAQTKLWPIEKPSKNSSSFESASSTSKRHHKHKHRHHHHHHHGDRQHHHHHQNRKHRAKSAESIRNRQHQTVISPSKVMVTNPQYIEQDQQQQQQQQQPMIVYREVQNGEGYTVDGNGLATVPYGFENETALVDDQQAPMFVYREQAPQQQQSIMTDGISQQVFFNPEQETILQQSDPFVCLSHHHHHHHQQQQQQPQPSQIVYCTDSNQQDYLCTSSNHNILQQSISSPPAQQQFLCLDNTATTMQPTIINQIPVFNPLSANATSPSFVSLPQQSLQRAASMVIPHPQSQPLQIIQQPQPLQVLQQSQPLQVLQQQQPFQVIQQPQSLQIIQQPQTSAGQLVQIASAAPPQVMQGQSVLQTIQIPSQAVAANPQFLYQRPYDPVVVPIQNQQVAIAQPPVVALSQPSYAPSRIVSAAPVGGGVGGQPSHGPNMFRHALLRTVADRTGVPMSGSTAAGIQLMQPTAGASLASNPNLLIAGGMQRSASLPIIPLTPGGLLIPFQPSQTPGFKPGPLPRAGGYPSTLRNFDDIRRQMQAQRAQLLQTLQQPIYSRIPSPPVLSAASSGPYAPGNSFSRAAPYNRPFSTGLPYSQPSVLGSAISAPYVPLRR